MVPGDGQRVAGEPEIAPGAVLHPRQLEGGDRVGIAPLAEGHPPGEEVEGLVLLLPLLEALQLRTGGDVVLLVEQLLEPEVDRLLHVVEHPLGCRGDSVTQTDGFRQIAMRQVQRHGVVEARRRAPRQVHLIDDFDGT